MAISRIGSQTGTTSLTIPTHQAGDLIVAFAFRDGSTTAPSLPAGQNWSSPSNATRAGTTCSHRTAYKIATSSSEATGTFTNATSLIVVVYRGVNQNQPIGTNTVNSGSSTSIRFAATNPLNLDGSSWLLGFAGHRSTDVTIETAPSGMTNITSVSDATDECSAHDTNGGRTSNWSSTNASVGGTASGWTSHVLEIRGERKCMFNISQFRAGFAQVRAGLQVIEDQLVIALAPSGFTVDAVTFDGTVTYLSRASAFTGASQSGQMIFSAWVAFENNTGDTQAVFVNPSSEAIGAYRLAGGTFAVDAYESTFTDGVTAETTGSIAIGSTYHHILIAVDTNKTTGNFIANIYVDDVLSSTIVSQSGANLTTLEFDGTDWYVGRTGGGGWLSGSLAELYVAFGQYLDLSVEANRRKFITAGGKPVDLGSDGSTPTGTAPTVYLSVRPGDAASDFAINRGTGGDFTENGTLTLAATSPSD